jgi:hypothetical protein
VSGARVDDDGERTVAVAEPAGVSVPNSDILQADACASAYKYHRLSRIILESKKDMRKRGARSPYEWDAVALTFAEPVASERSNFNRPLVYPPLSIV